MDGKFHRETATIYDFARARRPVPVEAPRERIEPRLASAEVVSMRGSMDCRTRQGRVEMRTGHVDFSSAGWYHQVAIDRTDPPRS